MSNLSERLADLITDTHKDVKTIAEEVGLPASCFTFYLKGERVPTVESMVKIADYFNCSTDYLLGLEEENKYLKFKPCPPFPDRLEVIKKLYNFKTAQICESAGISRSGYYSWKRGEHMPFVDNLVKLAKQLDCRVDFILGRES